ncbi:hypothetical protein SNOG_00436 [Parastagonospora nodorum SN15]|uniref:Uncharacterized protein n=1 Tax=Phaeosphaeria nodorum (strain SN15 / ATCC MYA-4574 / FGSC 10173) TaxID=321614 RepID=Q0V6C8_PHANO|nr:hypothetical protein SNOG_00436 [Parastagonospora nodorum SN15]EAT91931.1 hypothetical protein SNOG_00436 [Parastagonospora nodorum SN15]
MTHSRLMMVTRLRLQCWTLMTGAKAVVKMQRHCEVIYVKVLEVYRYSPCHPSTIITRDFLRSQCDSGPWEAEISDRLCARTFNVDGVLQNASDCAGWPSAQKLVTVSVASIVKFTIIRVADLQPQADVGGVCYSVMAEPDSNVQRARTWGFLS